MDYINWREFDTPEKMIEHLQYSKKDTKFSVLKYVCDEKKDLDLLKDLLNSSYYTPEEVAACSSKSYGQYDYEPGLSIINEYACKAWKKLHDAEQILFLRTGTISSTSEELYVKLKFFYETDKEIYNELRKAYLRYKNIYKVNRQIVIDVMEKDNYITKDFILDFFEDHPLWKKNIPTINQKGLLFDIMENFKEEKNAKLEEKKNSKAEKKTWKNSTDVNEIIRLYLLDDKEVNKYDVIKYFSKKKKDIDIVSKLLEIGFCSANEINSFAEITNWRYDEFKELLINYVFKKFDNIENASDIWLMRVNLIPSINEEICMKIKHFSKINIEFCKEMIRVLPSLQANLNFDAKYIIMSLSSDETLPTEVVEQLIQEYSNYSYIIESNPRYRKFASKMLYNKIDSDWKTKNSYELVMYCATEDNKWEILEHFAKHNEKIFNSIVKYYSFVKKPTVSVGYSMEEVLSRYADCDLDTLPLALKDYVLKLIQQKNNYEKSRVSAIERNRRNLLDFKNVGGQTLQLFKVKQIPMTSKDDYCKVLKKFLQTPDSISGFCSHYQIDDVNGFKKMLEIFSMDESCKSMIKEKLERSREDYIKEVKRIIEEVCVNGESISKIISSKKQISLETILGHAKSLYPNCNYDALLAKKVVDYYYDRITVYNNARGLSCIKQMLTYKEVAFIVGREKFQDMIRGKECVLAHEFYSKIAFLVPNNKEYINEKVDGKIVLGLSKYNKKFRSDEYFKCQTFVVLDTGENVEVTPEIVEKAYRYAKSNNLYTSQSVMKKIIKVIVEGKIKLNDDNRESENSGEDCVFIDDIKNIDDYFKMVDKRRKK